MADHSTQRAHDEPPAVRRALIGIAVTIMVLLVVVPLVYVFVGAFADGVGTYWENLAGDYDTLHSILLTLNQ